jgi:uncharacterized membrane protein YfcA
VLLAALVMLVGASVLLLEHRRSRGAEAAPDQATGAFRQGALGGTASLVSGLFGLGGPMVSVPLMVLAGVPILSALAAAQAQSVVVASVGLGAYLAHGAIAWPLVVLTGLPQLAGVWLGWRIAHALPARPLKIALACTLIALGPVISLSR